jgi:hypothetical protein
MMSAVSLWKAQQPVFVQNHTPHHDCASIVLIADNYPETCQSTAPDHFSCAHLNRISAAFPNDLRGEKAVRRAGGELTNENNSRESREEKIITAVRPLTA